MLSFSIITPTLGESRFLADTLESISSQADSNCEIEHLVVAPPGMESVATKTDHSLRSLLTQSSPAGAADAFNRGLEQAAGDFIGCLADDDVYLTSTLNLVKAVFLERPEIDLIYGGIAQIDEDGVAYNQRVPRRLNMSRVKTRSEALLPSLFFRRQILEQVGPLDRSLKHHYWYDFVLRCYQGGYKFHRIRDCLAGKRRHRDNRHQGNLPIAVQVAKSMERVELLLRRLGEVPVKVALEHGHCCAVQQGFDPIMPGYDALVLENASKVKRSLHSPDVVSSGLGAPMEWARMRGAHIRIQAAHSLKYPRELTRFLPQPMGPYLRSFFQSRLFQLHQHAPRKPRLADVTEKNASDRLSIGIVTPNLNSADYLQRTIESVVSQEYPLLQYVVQDGQSTDHSVEVIKRYANRLHHWDSQADSGQTQAINRGLRHVDTDIMAYLNSDDILLPGSLPFVSEFFHSNPDVDVIYGHRLIIDDNDQEIGRWVLPKHDDRVIAFADYVPQETMFWRRSAWNAVGASLDESFQFAMDWDLILRFRAAGMKFVRVPRFLGAFRAIETQKTHVLLETLGQTEMNRLRHRELDRIPTSREMRRTIRLYRIRQWVQHHALTISESTMVSVDSKR